MYLRSISPSPGSWMVPTIAQTAPSPNSTQAAWWMFMLVAGLLVLFLSMVAIIAINRALRRGRDSSGRRTARAESSTSAWEEAGRRAKPADDDVDDTNQEFADREL